MENCISGVILYDETIRQKAKDGTPLVDLIAGIRRDPRHQGRQGRRSSRSPPARRSPRASTVSATGSKEYYELGARFAKWRAVIDIAPGMPSGNCIHANAQALARYAALCQEADIVPIVEPEVLMDGPVATHDIDTCYAVTEQDAEVGVPRALPRQRQRSRA